MIAIITIAASGVLAAIIAYRLNATKEHVFFLRQKVEELYLAIERYDRMLGIHYMRYYGLFQNKISYNQLLDMQIERDGGDVSSGPALDMLTMLINVYFPNLKPRLETYTSSREAINKMLADHNRAYKQGEMDGTPWLQPFHQALLQLELAAQDFKREALQEAAALAPAGMLWPRSLSLSVLFAKAKNLPRIS